MSRIVLSVVVATIGLVLVSPVLLLILPFWLMSIGVSAFARLTEPVVGNAVAPGQLIKFDPVLGWRTKENLKARYLIRRDDIYPIVTDSEGWSGRRSLEESEIVIVGDSFASGFGVGQEEAFWELTPELKIKPVGCPGYDMVQEVEVMRQLRDRLFGKLVIWFIYLENDIPDSIRPHWRGYRKPFVRRSQSNGRWEVVSHHVRKERWTHSKMRYNMRTFAYLCGPGPVSDYHYAACRFLVGKAGGLCANAGAELVVVTVPNVNQLDERGCRYLSTLRNDAENLDPEYPDTRLREICDDLNLTVVCLQEFLSPEDYKRFEKFHWNLSGHRKVATVIRRIWSHKKLKPSQEDVRDLLRGEIVSPPARAV